MVQSQERMRIGDFARRADVSVDTVRFYERRGVLHPAPRTTGGYRTFGQHDLERVRLTRQLQGLGMSVAEIVDALAVHDAEGASCSSERWRLEQVEVRIEGQLAALRRTRRLIRDTLAACEAGSCQLADHAGASEGSNPDSRE